MDGREDVFLTDYFVLINIDTFHDLVPLVSSTMRTRCKSNGDRKLLGGGVCLHSGDEKIGHHVDVSAFSEYEVVSKNSLVKVDEDLPFEKSLFYLYTEICI